MPRLSTQRIPNLLRNIASFFLPSPLPSQGVINDGSFLSEAIEEGNLKNIELALQRGADPTYCEYVSPEEEEALESDTLDLIDEALEKIDNTKSSTNDSVVIYASNNAKYYSNHLLHTIASHGSTPLCQKILGLLIQHNANVNISSEEETFPLALAVSTWSTEAVKTLIKAGADINAYDIEYNNPLLIATETAADEIIRLLVAAKADVTVRNKEGKTPLHFAVKNGRPDIVSLLTKAGADINACDNQGNTPLMTAIKAKKPALTNVIETLIQHKADLNITDNLGKTPLDYLKENPYKKVMLEMIKQGARSGTVTSILRLVIPEQEATKAAITQEHSSQTKPAGATPTTVKSPVTTILAPAAKPIVIAPVTTHAARITNPPITKSTNIAK